MLLVRRTRLRSPSFSSFSTSIPHAASSFSSSGPSSQPFAFAKVKPRPNAKSSWGPTPADQATKGARGEGGFKATAFPRSSTPRPDAPAQGGRPTKAGGGWGSKDSWASPDAGKAGNADWSTRKGRDRNSSSKKSSPGPSTEIRRAPPVEGDFEADQQQQARREATRRRELERQRKPVERDVYLPFSLTVASLAKLIGKRLSTVQRVIQQAGLPYNDAVHLMTAEDASMIVAEFRLNPIIDSDKGYDIYPDPPAQDQGSLPLRPPIVTIMGHVDHGKTTLLDTLRKASVAKGEAGGITQHIGAFSVTLPPSSDFEKPRTICFLDTPGHAAFTAMRARGAGVTDIVILVVAADDGVMPQTKEVINLVKDSDNVQMVVAINKVDKHGANVGRIKTDLAANQVYVEDLGGETPAVEVSGLTGKGLDDLMETVSTLAEVAELKAENTGRVEGVVLESQVTQGKGTVATVLITRGHLNAGAVLVAGQTWAKVRTITNDKGQIIKSCGPGSPVSITGWKSVPSAGQEVLETKDGESSAIKAVTNRARGVQIQKDLESLELINEVRRAASAEHEEALQKRREVRAARSAAFLAGEKMPASEWIVQTPRETEEEEAGKQKELLLIVKGDVSGTVEAVVGTLETIGNKEAKARIIRSGVGDVQPSDVEYAASSGATIIGFSVGCARSVHAQAARAGVDVYLQGVIYRLIEEVTNRVAGLLPPILETRSLGEGAVVQLFDIKLKGGKSVSVAGCRVNNGLFNKAEKMRVLRNGVEVFDGSVSSLKFVKEDVQEVRKGSECGLQLEGFDDLQPADVLQCYKVVEKPRKL